MSDLGAGSTRGSGSAGNSAILEAKDTFSTLQELSRLLNTGLDRESLALCVRLCEQGAHPEALATVIRELRRESQAIKAAAGAGSSHGPSSTATSNRNLNNKENHY